MTDSWNQDGDNFWNQEGAFEEAVNDLADHIHFTEEERLDEAAREHQEFLAEMAEDDKELDLVIEHGEHLSRIPGLRDRCNSLKDYIALISSEGRSIYPHYDCQQIDDEDILHDTIIELCYSKLIGTSDINKWSDNQLNSTYIDTDYLICSGEYSKYLEKVLQLFKNAGIDSICSWLPSVVKYIEKQRGTSNAQHFKKWMEGSKEDIPF